VQKAATLLRLFLYGSHTSSNLRHPPVVVTSLDATLTGRSVNTDSKRLMTARGNT